MKDLLSYTGFTIYFKLQERRIEHYSHVTSMWGSWAFVDFSWSWEYACTLLDVYRKIKFPHYFIHCVCVCVYLNAGGQIRCAYLQSSYSIQFYSPECGHQNVHDTEWCNTTAVHNRISSSKFSSGQQAMWLYNLGSVITSISLQCVCVCVCVCVHVHVCVYWI